MSEQDLTNQEQPNLDEFDLDFGEEAPYAQPTETPIPQEEVPSDAPSPEPAPLTEGEETPPPVSPPNQEASAPGEEAEEDPLEALRKQLAEAQDEILRLRNYSLAQPTEQPTPAPTPSATPQPSTPAPVSPLTGVVEGSSVDFLVGSEFTDYFETPEKFNALLNRVASTTFQAAVTAAQERILRQIPQVVEASANQHLQIRDVVGNFYQANPDLEPYKPAVSMAALKIHNDNPSLPLAEVLGKAATETRRFLRLKAGAPVQRVRKPAQPVGSGGGARPQTPSLSDQEQQILDLLS